MPPVPRKKNEAALPQYTVDPQDLHWAMHAVVSSCPRERYDAMAPLRSLPLAPPAANPEARSRRPRSAPASEPVFGPRNKK